ncbi:hypothetical protein ACFT2C_04350 [Promicromonospora sp. NPDC057138]|uniref:hypothetical protein n=1 Tax=Promicromonospora sp. NPDC057138 TaxID=3346031 RepID=UPI00363A6CCB
MAGTTDRAFPEHLTVEPGAIAIREVLQAVAQILELGNIERVASLSIKGDSVAIQPSKLDDGEHIARALGMTAALDHPTALPPITDWSGDVAGLEVHVRAALRTSAGQEW